MIQEKINLKEAAALAGVSKVTLWRLIQKGELEASQDEKKRYSIQRETFLRWCETFQPPGPATEKRFMAEDETLPDADETPGNVSHRCSETPETPEMDEDRFTRDFETVEMVPAELHRLALESVRHALESARRAEARAERAERQMEALGGQLVQYQQALQERAESLIEKEAIAKQAEFLAQENAQRLSRYEEEQLQWAQELETTRSRVHWLEKRVPRWVRGLFGAG